MHKRVTIPTLNTKPQRLLESHQKAGVKQYYCSDFLASMSLLAEGECGNDSHRNAMVVISDLKTGEFKGRLLVLFEKPFTWCFKPKV